MANKKFSQFETATNTTGLEVVGTQDGNNVKVDAALLSGGDYIPLSGTEVGKPVTGDVEFSSGQIKIGDGSGFLKVETINDGGDGGIIARNEYLSLLHGAHFIIFQDLVDPVNDKIISFSGDALVLSANNSSRGFSGQVDFTPNIGPLDYVQYKLLPKVADNYPDDAAAAVGGISVGAMYHTAGVVKIRLV